MIEPLERGDLDAAAALLERVWPGGAVVAAEKLFEPGTAEPRAFAARESGELAGLAVVAGRYLRVMAVDPAHRGRGVGAALLAAAGSGELIAAAEPGNYLTPGVDAGDAETLGWLERRGFARRGEAVSLLIDVAGNPAVTRQRLDAATDRLLAAGYAIGAVDNAAVAAEVERQYGAAWGREVARAARVFTARDRGGGLAGFAARDGNNRGLGGFGPAATRPEHRGQGVGAALLLACLLDVAAAGHARCTVGWIGPRAFYQRVAGIAGERRYVQMRRPSTS